MKKRIKIMFGVVLLLVFCGQDAFSAQKALLVGVDGVQLEKLQAINPANFNRLSMAKSYTGGVVGESSEQDTNSGPGWATILTGVWKHKHFIATNDSGEANPAFPSIFKRLKTANGQLKVGSFAHWAAINNQFFPADIALANQSQSDLTDANAVAAAVNFINAGGDFTFVHLDDVDHAGHSYGFGSAYNSALVTIDQQLGQLLDAVAAKKQQTGDDWLIIVTTDHGRELSGYNHGGQSLSEKTTFIASNKMLNAEFSPAVVNVSNTSLNGLYGYASATAILPTIMSHMGYPIQASWQLDGVSLLGSLGVRKVMKGASSTLGWYAQGGGNVAIYNANTLQLLAQVPAATMAWNDPGIGANSMDYLLTYNGIPVNYRANKRSLVITSIFNLDANTTYFFRDDGRYVKYNKPQDKAESGYPLDVNNTNWPGLSAYRLQLLAGFNGENGKAYFFLKDGRFIRYDIALDSIDTGYPKQVDNSTWPGLSPYLPKIRASLVWKSADKKLFLFLSDGTYLRINLTTFSIDAGYPKSVDNTSWPGLGSVASNIVSAMKWDDTKAYFFLSDNTYIRYSITNDAADTGYPKVVDNSTWYGLLNP